MRRQQIPAREVSPSRRYVNTLKDFCRTSERHGSIARQHATESHPTVAAATHLGTFE